MTDLIIAGPSPVNDKAVLVYRFIETLWAAAKTLNSWLFLKFRDVKGPSFRFLNARLDTASEITLNFGDCDDPQEIILDLNSRDSWARLGKNRLDFSTNKDVQGRILVRK